MSKKPRRGPTLCRHKRTGHAYAKFDGRQLWFGRYEDPRSHERFAQTLAEWQANGFQLPPEDASQAHTVADVIARYLEFAEGYYCRPDGSPSREVANLRDAVRAVLACYGSLEVGEFGLRQLKQVRQQLIERGLARRTINDRINRTLRVFAWAAEEELCAPEMPSNLKTLRALPRGRSQAKESKRVVPVTREQFEAALEHVTRPVAGVLQLMWHTGMRPGEACSLRPADLDQQGRVWFYRPLSHKTEIYGKERSIAIGPMGQAVLRLFLDRVPRPVPDSPLFCPREAMQEVRHLRRQNRKTPLWASHQEAQQRKRKAQPAKEPKEAYTPNSLLGAVKRACKAADIPHWTPNQIRHAAATRIRKEIGLEAARAVLGHSSAQVTQIYAELDRQLAERTMEQLG